ncbi:transposase [Nonomuraea dietziae]|uniref:Transposase n=1 Tax=Nonomuraea dietziae TaxID=65515 RepID=A0A7W5V6S7_9ACTN|nr:transposase [Nonomuraea dietziae]
MYVATSGCAWRQLPLPVFGASWQTVNRRFTEWSAARVLAMLYRILLDEHPAHQQIQKTKQHGSRVLAPDDLMA